MNQYMTRLLLLMAGVFIVVSSCRSKSKPPIEYVNHDKWIGYGDLSRHPLKGQPKEVREDFYRQLSDTTPEASGKHINYERYRFDKEGNMVYYNFVIDSMISGENFMTIDENGFQYKSINKDPVADTAVAAETLIESVKVGPGVFRETKTRRGEKSDGYSIMRFENGGDIVSREAWRSDTMVNKVIEKYVDGKIHSIVNNDRGMLQQSIRYYYSSKGILDSSVESMGGVAMRRELFINNEQGDPIIHEKWRDGNLDTRQRFVYRYDDKGNWIRKLEYADKQNPMYNMDGPDVKFPGYSLTVRQITY